MGVLAAAKTQYANVSNVATAALSNPLHCLLAVADGDPKPITDDVGFVKRELTRRWRRRVGWDGSMFGGYACLAIITPATQLATLAYVMAHGCKENLVEDPRDWPGFNCAASLVTGEPMQGHWFGGTQYGRAAHREKVKKNPPEVRREDYAFARSFAFDELPAFAHFSDDAYRGQMFELVEAVKAERRRSFDAPPLGAEAVCAVSPLVSRSVPTPPWFEHRRRFIVWDNVQAFEVRAYLDRCWEHQVRFRAGGQVWRTGNFAEAQFPELCFIPGWRPRPIAHQEQSTG